MVYLHAPTRRRPRHAAKGTLRSPACVSVHCPGCSFEPASCRETPHPLASTRLPPRCLQHPEVKTRTRAGEDPFEDDVTLACLWMRWTGRSKLACDLSRGAVETRQGTTHRRACPPPRHPCFQRGMMQSAAAHGGQFVEPLASSQAV